MFAVVMLYILYSVALSAGFTGEPIRPDHRSSRAAEHPAASRSSKWSAVGPGTNSVARTIIDYG